jgi:thioredoxin 1
MNIIKFYAPWCAPCKALAPTLSKVAVERGIDVEEVNIDSTNGAEVASQYRVMSVPTVVFLKDGKEVGRFTGNAPEHVIVTCAEVALNA